MGGVSMEWKLKDLTVDGKGSYGIGAPAVPYQEDKLTYLRITDINDDGSLNFSDLKSVDAEDAEKYILKENDIVFARTGNSTGRSYFYEKQHGTFVYAGFLIKFSLDPNKVNPRIMKYYTHSKPYFDWVNSFDTGATRGNINAKTYGDMEIELPSRKVQDKIVSILSSLDRKIELNNKINADLEEMAQAIFKNWFVDFEPFKDGKFVDSELGMIPEGWKVGTIGDIVEFQNGFAFSSKDFSENGEYKIITIKSVQDGCLVTEGSSKVTEYPTKMPAYCKLQSGDILLSLTGNVGRCCLVTETNLLLNQRVAKIKAKECYDNSFSYALFRLKETKELLISISRGTAQANLSPVEASKLPMVIPSEDARKKFSMISGSIMDKITSIHIENRTLSTLRDTLLPRLMSGELEVPE